MQEISYTTMLFVAIIRVIINLAILIIICLNLISVWGDGIIYRRETDMQEINPAAIMLVVTLVFLLALGIIVEVFIGGVPHIDCGEQGLNNFAVSLVKIL